MRNWHLGMVLGLLTVGMGPWLNAQQDSGYLVLHAPGANQTIPFGLNNAGDVVGLAEACVPREPDGQEGSRAKILSASEHPMTNHCTYPATTATRSIGTNQVRSFHPIASMTSVIATPTTTSAGKDSTNTRPDRSRYPEAVTMRIVTLTATQNRRRPSLLLNGRIWPTALLYQHPHEMGASAHPRSGPPPREGHPVLPREHAGKWDAAQYCCPERTSPQEVGQTGCTHEGQCSVRSPIRADVRRDVSPALGDHLRLPAFAGVQHVLFTAADSR